MNAITATHASSRLRRHRRAIVLAGLASLAVGMGIGRFAFTPLLPLMQSEGLTTAHATWIAAANYLGYLFGALLIAVLNTAPVRAARAGLLTVAIATLAMALHPGYIVALALRFAAGVASAYVLIGVSAWLGAALAVHNGKGMGSVYSGVGIGMALAGTAALVVALGGHAAEVGWALLGVLALAGCALTWPVLGEPIVAMPATAVDGRSSLRPLTVVSLLACYGAFGFGYIVPATFLPGMARDLLANPFVFGSIWPVFGLAAALSTSLVSGLSLGISARTMWAASQVVMAIGVLLPALAPHSVAGIAISALCVGGTFMIATMAGLQEARHLGGAAAPRLMAAMTVAFATGQLLGPLSVGLLGDGPQGRLINAVFAAVALMLSSIVLLVRKEHRPAHSAR